MVPALILAMTLLSTGKVPATPVARPSRRRPELAAAASTTAGILMASSSEGLGWNDHYFAISVFFFFFLVIEGLPVRVGKSTLASTQPVLFVELA